MDGLLCFVIDPPFGGMERESDRGTVLRTVGSPRQSIQV